MRSNVKYLWIFGMIFFVSFISSAQQAPIADGHEKFLGNIYSTSQISGFTNYWNQVTPENEGKWGSVEGTRDQYNWAPLDNAYALARDNGYPFKLHVLIWGNQQPSWIETLSTSEQLEEIIEWMDTLAAKYPDVDFVEVVNEPLHDPPNSAGNGGGNYINALGGNGTTGWDWVITSFELARERFPNAELMLNDYGIINNASAVNQYLQIINLLKDRDLIDQIGIQSHAFNANDAAAATITTNLNTLGATGLPIYITELDLDGETDQVQLERYQRVFPAIWENQYVKGVTLWGWKTGMWRTAQKAYLVATNGTTERPALVWLRQYVSSTIEGNVTGLDEKGEFLLYPNPVTNNAFTIRGVENMTALKIMDLRGNVIQTMNLNKQPSIEIFLQKSPGVYLVELSDGLSMTYKKIVLN